MSNPRAWRGKGRTTTPNSRQKRNRLFLDEHALCQSCGKRPPAEAHHDLPAGHPSRYDWQFMKALCVPCHVTLHQHRVRVYKSIRGG
ncbi:hypothetical protein [Sphingomonas adhaesiva]|uniref:hypothetical protein n=1 Tax=Sphingomonas adhaesiva TaxID=28212 RepID=UPI002FFC4F50